MSLFFRKPFSSSRPIWRRTQPGFLWAEDSANALACIATIARCHGLILDLRTLRLKFPNYTRRLAPRELLEPAAELGLSGRVLNCTVETVRSARLPCILFWNLRRYVVLESAKAGQFAIYDPYFGRRILNQSEFSSHFTGAVVELAPDESFAPGTRLIDFNISELWHWSKESKTGLLQGLLLSLFLQFAVLLLPLFMQIVIDNIIPSGDISLLIMMAIGFGLLCVFNSTALVLRALTFQRLANVLCYDASTKLYHHLVNLPMKYFQDRGLGEIFQKFRSIDTYRQFVSSGNIGAVSDAILSVATGALMMVYAPSLAAIVFGVTATYVIARIASSAWSVNSFAEATEADSREATQFLETVRGMQSIKLLLENTRRESVWRNLFASKINLASKANVTPVLFQGLSSLASGVTDIFIVVVSVQWITSGFMTIGILTAFLAYKVQFMFRTLAVADQYAQYRTLRAPIERIADIALQTREPSYSGNISLATDAALQIELREVTYRAEPGGKAIVEGLNFTMQAGEFVCIGGRSGAGKTTFLKLLLGLYIPEKGEILINGRSLVNTGAASIRKVSGIVMQDEILFAGTIADNITSFDESPSAERLLHCAEMANIHEEISALPRQYETLVGDLGFILSSGQKQRIMIARAFYRSPKLIIMDEGTANLDPEGEATILKNIRAMGISVLMIAHSERISEVADRRYLLEGGRLREIA